MTCQGTPDHTAFAFMSKTRAQDQACQFSWEVGYVPVDLHTINVIYRQFVAIGEGTIFAHAIANVKEPRFQWCIS